MCTYDRATRPDPCVYVRAHCPDGRAHPRWKRAYVHGYLYAHAPSGTAPAMVPHMTKAPKLTPEHTRVLERLEDRGALTAAHAALYPQLADLVALGLADVHADGTYTPAGAAPPRASRPRPEAMQTLAVRVPEAWLARLEAIGPDRSTAARTLIAQGLGVDEARPRAAVDPNAASAPRRSITPAPGRVRRRAD
jgi:hypothetical protein